MEIKITDKDMEFLRMAAEKSERSVENGGGPFGAVIVKNDEVLAVESNSVTIDNDPTAHAEVNAIRSACRKVGSFKLDGCYVYRLVRAVSDVSQRTLLGGSGAHILWQHQRRRGRHRFQRQVYL